MTIKEQLIGIKNRNDISQLYELYSYLFTPPVPIIPIKIRKGEKIIRARLNDKKWKHFENINDLLYPPSDKANKQRLNIDKYPTFYGGKFIADPQAVKPRAIVTYEISEFLRENNTEGIQRITYSVWEVIEEMTLIVIPFNDNYNKLNKKMVELESEWKDFIKKVSFDSNKLELCNFLSTEISKDKSDYFYTSHFGHFACNILKHEHDGIAFPTVKLEGDGLNVAIRPETVNKKLRLIGATECHLIKRDTQALVLNVSDAIFNPYGKIKYITRKDHLKNSKDMKSLMTGIKFIN